LDAAAQSFSNREISLNPRCRTRKARRRNAAAAPNFLIRTHVTMRNHPSGRLRRNRGRCNLSYYRLTLPEFRRTENMETTRLSSKGQLVLPKAIREADAWTEGTEFIVERVPEGVLLRPVRSLPATRLEDVIGCAGYRGAARSAADMQRAIARGVKARRGRGRY
jgi:AbrB family looped-hinge helix DNA binding protein